MWIGNKSKSSQQMFDKSCSWSLLTICRRTKKKNSIKKKRKKKICNLIYWFLFVILPPPPRGVEWTTPFQIKFTLIEFPLKLRVNCKLNFALSYNANQRAHVDLFSLFFSLLGFVYYFLFVNIQLFFMLFLIFICSSSLVPFNIYA